MMIPNGFGELGCNIGCRFCGDAGRINLVYAARMINGRTGTSRIELAICGDRSLADNAACMDQMKVDPAMQVSTGCDFVNRTKSGIEKVNDVRTKVPERSTVEPPGRCEHAAQEPSCQKMSPTPERFALMNRVQKGSDSLDVAPCQHQLCRHSRVIDHACKLSGVPEVQGNRLLQKERLARLGPNHGDVSLDVGGNRERESVSVDQHVFDRMKGRRLMSRGNLFGSSRASGPNTSQCRGRVGGEHWGVKEVRPWPCAHQPDSNRISCCNHLLSLAWAAKAIDDCNRHGVSGKDPGWWRAKPRRRRAPASNRTSGQTI